MIQEYIYGYLPFFYFHYFLYVYFHNQVFQILIYEFLIVFDSFDKVTAGTYNFISLLSEIIFTVLTSSLSSLLLLPVEKNAILCLVKF